MKIPLLNLPGCNHQRYALLDYCHIFHLGYGCDIAASTVVLMAKLGHYGSARSLDGRLEVGYARFDAWCRVQGRVSSIDDFSSRGFGLRQK